MLQHTLSTLLLYPGFRKFKLVANIAKKSSQTHTILKFKLSKYETFIVTWLILNNDTVTIVVQSVYHMQQCTHA